MVTPHPVAHDRGGHYAKAGTGNPLHQSQRQQGLEVLHDRTGERQADIGDDADEQHRSPPEAIGKGAGEEGADPCPQEIGADDILPVIPVCTQIIRHQTQRRQHRIDAEGLQAHQRSHQHD